MEDFSNIITETRFLSPEPLSDECASSLRPVTMEDYIGQKSVKKKLAVFIEAARGRDESIDHVLLSGPPGLGKTTLAHIIAREMEVAIKVTSGPIIQRPGDLAAILTHLGPKDILFIDEIHRLPRNIEEILYPAMEDFQLDILIGKGPSAQTVRLKLNPFTLIGATTQAGRVSSPLRTRCGIVLRLDFYHPEELKIIVEKAAMNLDIPISRDAAMEIARRARGTPRIALRILRRVRDFAQVRGDGNVTLEIARQGLTMLEIDDMGLDHVDHQLLMTILEKFAGGPVGLETVAVSMGEDVNTISDVYEPYLLQIGFIQRTSRGRVATPLAWRHFGLTPPPDFKGSTVIQESIPFNS
ncbi:MAG: Holliday junction branch migration DNA helicase RuvB [Candidatus Wallbacteria bacterium HGW-Wallbacteria-1]|jgi:Holliday junction DNA helicase RuvB|uniref:Holliday junction branch migration complex subunit RuvB n=1 Tax=Candidatus Wallbacteria bacterium HGW-Wallbacteria-1 TaxID=2013854 RepID=A0A2N1PQ59_9BACT|nr:MAG: Holliday junction branch migration DNA helicase RuvB [Candidatus Wallbacteria bacterium HGW-Wallbacteria-1]